MKSEATIRCTEVGRGPFIEFHRPLTREETVGIQRTSGLGALVERLVEMGFRDIDVCARPPQMVIQPGGKP